MGSLPRPMVRFRWAAPGGVAVAIGAVLAGTMLASAAAPNLPKRTPAELLASMAHAKLPRALSATLSEGANLGFPALPDVGGASPSPFSLASLISGTHTIQLWYAGPRQVRIALPVSFGETDLRVNGSQVWLWDSSKQTATHILPPAAGHYMMQGSGSLEWLTKRNILVGYGNPGPSKRTVVRAPEASPVPLTPLQAARRLLALVGPTTRVTVPGTTIVAGRDAYQLAIAPRSSQSLVGRILIAVDANTHLPLSVAVYARGTSTPAFHLGFSSLSFARPAASNFAFTPPPGARVKNVRLPDAPGMPGSAGALRPGALPPGAIKHLHAGPTAGARTFGSGWLTVAEIPAGPVLAAASGQVAPGGSAAYHSRLTITGPAARQLGPLSLLLKAAKPVHGAWGSGRLLRTSLISVLLTSRGQLLIGAVTPAVLYADASRTVS